MTESSSEKLKEKFEYLSNLVKRGYSSGANALSKVGSFKTKMVETISSGGYVLSLIFAILVSLANLFYNQNIALMFVLFILFGFFYFIGFKDGCSYSDRYVIFYLLFSFLSPLIVSGLGFLDFLGSFSEIIIGIVKFLILIYLYFAPVWIVFQTKGEKSTLVTIVKGIVSIILIILFISTLFQLNVLDNKIFTLNAYRTAEHDQLVIDSWKAIVSAPKVIWGYITDAGEGAKSAINQSFYYATHGSYEEKVDSESSVRQLGLSYKELELSLERGLYQQGDPVSALAVLESKSIGKTIGVESSCVVDKTSKNNFTGRVSPEEFNVYDEDIRDISCSFDSDIFTEVGSHKLSMSSKFDFETSAYLRRYFISVGDYNALRKTGEDPLVYYNIPSSEENGKYTNGPIALSVIKHGLLKPVDEKTLEFALGLKLENNRKMGWSEGVLLNINKLIFSIPSEFRVKRREGGELDCTMPFDLYPLEECIVDCRQDDKGTRCYEDCESYNSYMLDTKKLIKAKTNNLEYVKTPVLISCNLEAPNTVALLGGSPIAIKNFRAEADYDFEISIEKGFRVEKKEGYVDPSIKGEICGFETAYGKTEKINVAGIIGKVSDIFEDDLVSSTISSNSNGVCSEILKGIVAYQNRGDSHSGTKLGGITLSQISSMGTDSTGINLLELSAGQDLNYVSTYLNSKINTDCSTETYKVDCALAYLLNGNKEDMTGVDVIIALAKFYEGGTN